MQTAGQIDVRPFHETVIEAIRSCPQLPSNQIFSILRMLKDTKIPSGHDAIIEAIDAYFQIPGREKYSREIREIFEFIRNQKANGVKPDQNEFRKIDLDVLQEEAEQLVGLLKNRQFGLEWWNDFVNVRMKNVHALISIALRK